MVRTKRIPCHLIAGPLGVGKTTTILRLLGRRQHHEHTAVLVNDAGDVGLDGTLLSQGLVNVRVRSVPGGCICCTMLDELADHLRELLTEQRFDRVLIEPSGLAIPATLIDVLRELAQPLNLEVRPTIVLVNTTRFSRTASEKTPLHRMFFDSADILVLNWADKATPAKRQACMAWAEAQDPPKLRVI